MNVKIEQELNFVVDIDRRLFLDAQEAKPKPKPKPKSNTTHGKNEKRTFYW